MRTETTAQRYLWLNRRAIVKGIQITSPSFICILKVSTAPLVRKICKRERRPRSIVFDIFMSSLCHHNRKKRYREALALSKSVPLLSALTFLFYQFRKGVQDGCCVRKKEGTIDAGGIFSFFFPSSLEIFYIVLSHRKDNYLNTALMGLLKNFNFRKLRTYVLHTRDSRNFE